MRQIYLVLAALVLSTGCGDAPGKADRSSSGEKKDAKSTAKPSLLGTWVAEKPNEDGSTTTFIIEEGGKIKQSNTIPGKGESLAFTAEYLKISDKKIEVYAQKIEQEKEILEIEPFKLLWIDANTMEHLEGKEKSRFVRK